MRIGTLQQRNEDTPMPRTRIDRYAVLAVANLLRNSDRLIKAQWQGKDFAIGDNSQIAIENQIGSAKSGVTVEKLLEPIPIALMIHCPNVCGVDQYVNVKQDHRPLPSIRAERRNC
jgi:hypothetical protein